MWDAAVQAALESGDPAAGPPPAISEPERLRVAVTRLDLTDFRSYRSARLDCDSRPVILTGVNGAGKTNLLEALSFLAPGRGLRRARLSEIDRRDENTLEEHQRPWAIAARLETRDGLLSLGTGRDADPQRERSAESTDRRLVRIDGKAVKGQAALATHLNLVWLTPQMDRLFQEGASPRRRFLDRLVFGFDPEHAQRLSAYEHALRERSRLLRDGVTDAAWLGLLEEKMAREGVAVAAARLETVRRLDGITAFASDTSTFPTPRIAVSGIVESWLDVMPALAAEEKLAIELCAARRIDAAAGGALTGPHRSDLRIHHTEKNVAAEQCSTGEQKALLIAVVLAHARLRMEESHAAPILLLDEVAAHLDRQRRRALFDQLLSLRCQAWLTGTDLHLFQELGDAAQFFTVADGAIQSDRKAPGPPHS